MTTANFCFYLQNGLIQTSQTGGQWYSDTSPFSIPWLDHPEKAAILSFRLDSNQQTYHHESIVWPLCTRDGQGQNRAYFCRCVTDAEKQSFASIPLQGVHVRLLLEQHRLGRDRVVQRSAAPAPTKPEKSQHCHGIHQRRGVMVNTSTLPVACTINIFWQS